MKKYLVLLFVICFTVTSYAQKNRLNKKSGSVMKALVTDTEVLAAERAMSFAIGEALEQKVTEWVLKNREVKHGDAFSIAFLSMSKTENGQGTSILMRINQNSNPTEVLLLVFPEDNSEKARVMYITKDWITKTMNVLIEVASEGSNYNGPSEKGFNLHFTKNVSIKESDGTYSRRNIETDADISLAALRKWTGTKLIFDSDVLGEAKIELNSGGSDSHIFGYHPDGKFVIDYTEETVRLWDLENEMYFTLPLSDIILILFQD